MAHPASVAGAALLALALVACAADPTPSIRTFTPIEASDARLSWPLPALQDVAGRFGRFAGPDEAHREEVAMWNDGKAGRAHGGLLLSEAVQGRPLTDPDDPQDAIGSWGALAEKRPFFGELRRLEIDSTTTEWRRTAVGTATCILFVRRMPRPGTPAATLSGYYCAPPGVILSPEAGAGALRAITIRSAWPGSGA